MKINLIRFANSLDPSNSYLKDSEMFIEDLNNELFEDDIELVTNDASAAFSMCFIETGGSEQSFIKVYKELKEPIFLLSNSKNNSLAACFEIRTFLEKEKKEHLILLGEDNLIAAAIRRIAAQYEKEEKIRNARLGVIGRPSDWLIASTVDYNEVKSTFGATLIDITSEELKEEINKGILPNIPRKEELYLKDFDKEEIDKALEIYSGLKRIIKKYELNGFTLRCFDLIGEYKSTACLAFGLLNEEGILAACEGDVPSLLSMLIIKESTGESSFQANPSRANLRNKEIVFAHCTLPLNMCNKYKLMTHFESGLGIGIRGEMDKGEITIFKLAPSLDKFLLLSGELVENLTLSNYCRTQINVKLSEQEFLYDFLNIPFGNHVLICYGDKKEEIYTLLMRFIGKKAD